MSLETSFTHANGVQLANLLASKILLVHPDFNAKAYISAIAERSTNLGYKQLIQLHADQLHAFLPIEYEKAIEILIRILGPINPHEIGMFKVYGWIMPIGAFVETYGLDHLNISLSAIEAITQRNTGEYAIRPFIRRYPDQSLQRIQAWAVSDNFHLRRLASEGLRPKLPWATKLDTFISNPEPVFDILNKLKEDEILFVKTSVANHLTDWLKVNPAAALDLIQAWRRIDNPHTKWILKRAMRKIPIAQKETETT